MNFFSSTPLRRVGAVVAGTALLLGSALLGPTAVADNNDGIYATAHLDLELHEDKTADMILNMSFDNLTPDVYCSEDVLELDDLKSIDDADDDVDVTLSTEDNSCILTMAGIPIIGFTDDDFKIKHQDNTYIVEIASLTDFSDYDSATMTVTFPGDVIEADENAKVSGNQASWDDVVTPASFQATGWDSANPATSTQSPSAEPTNTASADVAAEATGTGSANADSADSGSSGMSPLVWALIGILALVVIGGTVAIVVSRNRHKQPSPATGYPGTMYQPGQPYAPQQPGYQPQPGQPYAPQQPGYQPQPYHQPGQPGYGAPQQYQPGQQQQPPYNQPPTDPYAPR